MEHAVYNISNAAVRIQPHHCGFPVVITGNKQVFIVLVRRQMAASHTFDTSGIQLGNTSVFIDPERHNAFICDGIQGFRIAGGDKIRRIVHFFFIAGDKYSLFHVDIIDCDSLGLSSVGIGTYICHIFATHTTHVLL